MVNIEDKAEIEIGKGIEVLNQNDLNCYDRIFKWEENNSGRIFSEYLNGKKIRNYLWSENEKRLILSNEYLPEHNQK